MRMDQIESVMIIYATSLLQLKLLGGGLEFISTYVIPRADHLERDTRQENSKSTLDG